jgi:adenylate kinase
MKFVFLGPPGVGKGTYASRLAPKLGIAHISTGDIFREEVADGTALGKKIKSIMDEGELVPDEIVIEAIKERVRKADCRRGFILDGFPRTIEQAEALGHMFRIDLVLNISMPHDVLIEKISARRVCRECGDIYNVADIQRDDVDMPPMLPRVPGKCDKCGGKLYQRPDDKPDVIKERLENYNEQTKPLIEYYRKKKLLHDFQAKTGPEKVVPQLLKLLRKYKR